MYRRQPGKGQRGRGAQDVGEEANHLVTLLLRKRQVWDPTSLLLSVLIVNWENLNSSYVIVGRCVLDKMVGVRALA